jgi:predicted dehydrogenase
MDEGQAMVRAAQRYGRITQVGTQQRSTAHFRQVCEWVRNGRIGRVHTCRTGIVPNPSHAYEAPRKPPASLDWNLWLGPAPWAEYVPTRCHGTFRWYRDYSGGKMTDWGVHLNDIIQWGMGTDETGPVLIAAKGEMDPRNVQFEWPATMEVRYEYKNPDFTLFYHQPGIPDEPGKDHGMKFYGTEGAVFVNRAGFQCYDKAGQKRGPFDPTAADEARLFSSPGHQRHWLDCVKSRRPTFDDWRIGHRSTTLSHLGNIAYLLGRPIRWDPAREQVVGDDVAARMLSRPYRAPWRL